MPSFGTLKADTLTHSTAGSLATNFVVHGSAKGFVSFKGTSTVTVHDSQNVSSVTDIDTGRYRPNFTNSMSNDTYSPAGGCFDSGETGSGGHFISLYTDGGSTMATGSLSVSTREHVGGGRNDPTQVNITINGDLA
jgi:hypothetical protein